MIIAIIIYVLIATGHNFNCTFRINLAEIADRIRIEFVRRQSQIITAERASERERAKKEHINNSFSQWLWHKHMKHILLWLLS